MRRVAYGDTDMRPFNEALYWRFDRVATRRFPTPWYDRLRLLRQNLWRLTQGPRLEDA